MSQAKKLLTQLRKYLRLPYRTDAGHYKEYSRRQLAAELTAAGYAIHALGYNAEGEIERCATRPTVSVEAQPRVCYAGTAPDSFEIAAGGRVKLMYLQQAFPNISLISTFCIWSAAHCRRI